MSMLGLKVGLRTMARTTCAFAKRNAPKILVGVGIAGFVGTAVSAGRATLKVRDILEAKDQKLIEIEFNKGLGAISEEEAQVEIKKTKRSATIGIITEYAKPVGLGLASAGCVLGGFGIISNRAARFAANAYAAETRLHKYRGQIIKQLGPDVDQKVMNGEILNQKDILDKIRENEENEKKKAAAPDEEYAAMDEEPRTTDEEAEFLFAEETSPMWRNDPEYNKAFLMQAMRDAQDMLRQNGILFINDILIKIFGCARGTSYGAKHGWIYYKSADGKEPYVDFGLMDIDGDMSKRLFLEGVETNVWLKFNCLKRDITPDIDIVEHHRNFRRWPNQRPHYEG